MKKIFTIILLLTGVIALFATDYLFIFQKGSTVTSIDRATVDSIKFTSDKTKLSVYKLGTPTDYTLSDIDSITFSTISDESIKIIYNGTSVTVTNPFENKGVNIVTSGADVVVTSTLENKELTYYVSGTTTDGSLKLYSNYKYTLALNGASITNANGPAINIQSTKKCTLELVNGTTNTLADGLSYATSAEDQKATLFSEGQIIFKGTGTLNISSKSKHAICSDDYIEIEDGTVNVTSAAKDGIHTNDHFNLEGGTVNITATGDAVECEAGNIKVSGGSITSTIATADAKGLKSDSTLLISGGNVHFTVTGNQAKGLKSGGIMDLSGGIIVINTSGAAVTTASGSGYDVSYCTAIKGDTTINISGSNITITATGAGGKGISSDADIEISGGQVSVTTTGAGATYKNSSGSTDAYNATCITADSDIRILGGNVTCSSSGKGGKGISANATVTVGSSATTPVLKITTSGGEISSGSTSYSSPKALKADGNITFNSGTTTISSTDDGIKSETNVYLYGGTVTVTTSYEAIEAPYIYVSGAYVDVTAINDAINATKGTVSGGTESNDGSCLYVTSGTLIASCTNGDAIDSNGNITMTGGLVIANGPSSGVEEAADFNGTFNMNGGTFIGAGSNSNMTKSMSSTSTQPNIFLTISSGLTSSTFIDVRIGTTDVITFKPKNTSYKLLLSHPSMTKGASYTIYTGGSYSTSTNTGGLYTGGTYTTGTSKKTGTLSSSNTVNTISF